MHTEKHTSIILEPSMYGTIALITVFYTNIAFCAVLYLLMFFFATLVGTLIATAVGIWTAYNGYGVWALVAQQIINLTIDTVILWITVKWRPKKMFSFERLKRLYCCKLSPLIKTGVINNIKGLDVIRKLNGCCIC